MPAKESIVPAFRMKWFYLVTIIYLVASVYLIIHQKYWGFLFPIGVLFIFFFLFSLDFVWIMAVASTPLAINMADSELGFGVSIPSEPLMFGLLIIFFIKLFYERQYDWKILRHPISVVILIQLLWMLLTCINSEIPIVSFKYLLSRLWFVVPFFFMGVLLFRDHRFIWRFFWAYLIPLGVVVVYSTVHHASFGFNEEIGNSVMTPFYNDHTAYGAILALMLPPALVLSFNRDFSFYVRLAGVGVLTLLLIGLFLSYSRAAWIGSFAGLAVAIAVWLKIKFKYIFLAIASIVTVFSVFQREILDRLEKNKQDSSANFVEHVRSISNISSDASNLERINRWQAAFRLTKERPLLGWGPGTYQFVYAPYQMTREKTIISTNAGDKGNAHSEFIGPMSEQGIPGMLIVVALVIVVVYYGLSLRHKLTDRRMRAVSLAVTVGLITYFVHGLLNNFLDTDKLSVPVWAFIAMLVSLDVYSRGERKGEADNASESEIPTDLC
ncbi:MAG TPA: hypothetical protein DEO70_07350 [Bacteroidales bacterium]|nr:MAG: hypothetical protein A2X11_06970 [Bacteroidetes bacterium GWE2_42_24]OFY25954.1 MAG: hypothetical protein A2X09_04625 [Bacteroidetes bacterium GWF2_43_11]PKP22197.1 MAG: hypothetical protein CVU06_09635 [Bacteroidetes bacterium HGW-Bacteroidetes-22]HBZ66637.1 hypothetical protein [Bacteroidales bacterium]